MKDKFAVFCSGLCLAHCALVPFMLGLSTAGLLGEWLTSEWMHRLLLIPVVCLALWSLPSAYQKHQDYWPATFATIGIALLSLALLFHGPLETSLTVVGALILMVAHVLNRHRLVTWVTLQKGLAHG